MAQKEVITALKIETGQSENTIKALKKEISELKKSLESAEIGSEQFEKASRDLAAAQEQLKSIMDKAKQTVNAADGSYDALVATMSKLKKEWRATADEAKRNEIGKQIEAINAELKELDATLGNHQRNVGNYKEDIIDAYREIQNGSTTAGQAMEGSAVSCTAAMTELNGTVGEVVVNTQDYATAWGQMQKSTEVTRARFESVQKIASGLASGFAALQGVTALLGTENEDLQKVLVKVQAAMAIAQGIGGLKGLVEGISQAQVAFKGAKMGLRAMTTETVATTGAMNGAKTATIGATAAVNGFKSALVSTGIGALVVALGMVISKLTETKDELGDVNDELKEYNSIVDSVVNGTARWAMLYDTKAVDKYLEAIKAANGDITKLEEAKQEFEQSSSEQTDKYYQDRIKRFKELRDKTIDGFAGKLHTDYTQLTTKDLKANPKVYQTILHEEFVEKFDSYSLQQAEDLSGMFEDWKKWNKAIEDLEYEYKKHQIEQAEKAAEKQREINEKAVAEAEKQQEKAAAAAEKQREKDEADAKSKADKAAEINKRASESIIDTKEEELNKLKQIYEAEIKLLESQGIDTENLTEEYQKKNFEIIQRYLNKEQSLIAENVSQREKITNLAYETQSLSLDENDAVGAIQLEINKTLELQAIREQAFNEQMAQIQAVLDAERERDLLTAEQEAELLRQYNAIQQEKVLVTADATNQITALNNQMIEQQKADNRQFAQNLTATFTSALNAASSILSAVQEGIDTTNKEGFEKNKKLQIANATIGMLVGITNAMAGAYTSKTGPWDWILAGIQAAAIATTGGIQIANIKKQQYDGSGGNVGNLNGVGVTPNVSMADMIPINYTKELMTDTETTEMNKGNRVYVVESDISDTQRNVEVKESNSSF